MNAHENKGEICNVTQIENLNLPYMLFSDRDGQIYDHPYYRMAGFSGSHRMPIKERDLIPIPEYSKMFFIPDCPPIGVDPSNGEYTRVDEIEIDGNMTKCYAVAAFLEPGIIRTHLPAVDYYPKSITLPMWAYTAVGFKDNKNWASGLRIEYNHRWDPRNFDDRKLIPSIGRYKQNQVVSPLLEHLINCATENHCFAAKNLFLERWEAPIPVSQSCNANCIGCLSYQKEESCQSSHHRISFRPKQEEIVALAVKHLNKATDAIVSFGQGCEGEPLTEYKLISDSIRSIRKETSKGTININTNGSSSERIRILAENGLDSIRISLNSTRQAYYEAYYRPKDYGFKDVIDSIALSKKLGLYTMINYLVFPGITDQEEEFNALRVLIEETDVNFIHLKNLCIDPWLYIEKMPSESSCGMGMVELVRRIKEEFPDLELGYFNQAVE